MFITIFSCHFYRGGARMDGNFGGVTVCFLSRLEGFFPFCFGIGSLLQPSRVSIDSLLLLFCPHPGFGRMFCGFVPNTLHNMMGEKLHWLVGGFGGIVGRRALPMGREERECGFHAIKTITLYILLSVFIWVCLVCRDFVGIERVLASARIFLSDSYIHPAGPSVRLDNKTCTGLVASLW